MLGKKDCFKGDNARDLKDNRVCQNNIEETMGMLGSLN